MRSGYAYRKESGARQLGTAEVLRILRCIAERADIPETDEEETWCFRRVSFIF